MKLKLLLLFCLAGVLCKGQVDTTNANAIKLYKKNLTYYWIGRSCPAFVNTEYKYGFKIKCVGCIATLRKEWHNKRVVRKINKVYGKNWFEENISTFY